jgi:hypothetical protein
MTGVVNVITRPKDMLGTTVVVGTRRTRVSCTRTRREGRLQRFGRLLRATRLRPPDRTIPGRAPQTYPTFTNTGTEQARVGLQVDWDLDDEVKYPSRAAMPE